MIKGLVMDRKQVIDQWQTEGASEAKATETFEACKELGISLAGKVGDIKRFASAARDVWKIRFPERFNTGEKTRSVYLPLSPKQAEEILAKFPNLPEPPIAIANGRIKTRSGRIFARDESGRLVEKITPWGVGLTTEQKAQVKLDALLASLNRKA